MLLEDLAESLSEEEGGEADIRLIFSFELLDNRWI